MSKLKIGFIFGSQKISGGSYVILQHVDYLLEKGHSVDLITLSKVSITDSDIWHPTLKKVNFIAINEVHNQYDLVFATWWISPFHLYKVDARQYAYFVQSIEAYFFDDSQISSQLLAHSSYTLGLPIITEASWIKKDLEDRLNATVFLIRNGIRKDLYTTEGGAYSPRKKGGLRCLIEGPLTSNFKNVARTIDAVKNSSADEIWLLTSTPVAEVPHVDKVFSNIPIDKVGEIYRSCDVLIKQSIVEGMFGPPLEMFHCGGTAIVSEVTGYDEYIDDDYNAIVTPINDWNAVTAAVNELKSNPSKLARLQQNAKKTADSWPDWSVQSSLFEDAIFHIMRLPLVSRKELAYKTSYLLSVNELLKNSLQKYYIQRHDNATQSYVLSSTQKEGEELYLKQLSSTIEEPTRLRASNIPLLQEERKKRAIKLKEHLTETAICPKIVGVAISNEHIEELWHPIITKMGWEYEYICPRNTGYFTLYQESEILPIPEEKYHISTWYTQPQTLFKVIEEFKPNVILMHNGNHPAVQQIITLLKEKYSIPIVFSELGWFPQKQHIYFDSCGTNGKSDIAKKSYSEFTGKTLYKPSRRPFSKHIANNVLLVLQLENDTNFFEFNPYFKSNFEFIRYVRQSLPSSIDLYVKIHPLDHNAHIYDCFKQNSQITFVNDDIQQLLPKMSAVIAINSTVLLEALDFPLNIYKCGNSILDNKELVIDFDNRNLSKVWSYEFIDNMNARRVFKKRLQQFQINLTKKSIEQLSPHNPSLRVIYDAAQKYWKEHQKRYSFPQQKVDMFSFNNNPPQGHRELPKSLKDVYLSISKYDVISFDVFDTLIVRDIYQPSDIFIYMNAYVANLLNDAKFNHAHNRMEAEKVTRNYISMIDGEISLDDIYKNYLLITGLPAHLVQQIKENEIETELKFIKARESAFKLFHFAKEAGKKVIITSDFYLGEEFVTTALQSSGFDLSGVDIFVSCDIGQSKKSRKLYKHIQETLNVTASKILHIGDNFVVDIQNALSEGINCLHYPSAKVCLGHNSSLSSYFKLNDEDYLNRRTISHSIIIGLILNRIYDDPFSHPRNSLFNNSPKKLGLIALGPLVLTFTDWLVNHANSHGIQQLFFLARDGWILKKAFDLVAPNQESRKIKSFYLPSSRKLIENISYSIDFSEITKVLNSRFEQGTLAQLLKLKFNLTREDISAEALMKAGFSNLETVVSIPRDKIRILKLLQHLRKEIVLKSTQLADLFARYLAESGVSTSDISGVVDIGYFGSMQQILDKCMNLSKPLQGYYLATRWETSYIECLSDNVHGFIADKFTHLGAGNPNITKRLAYLEQLFSAPHNSISSLDIDSSLDKVIPIYYEHTGEELQYHSLNQIHDGALLLVSDYCNLVKKLGKSIFAHTYLPNYGEFIANALIETGNQEYFSILNHFILENRYNGVPSMLLPSTTSVSNVQTQSLISTQKLTSNATLNSIKGIEESSVKSVKSTPTKTETLPSVKKEAEQTHVEDDKPSSTSISTITTTKVARKELTYPNKTNVEEKILNLNTLIKEGDPQLRANRKNKSLKRLYAKYKRSPFDFFNDSKNPLIRIIAKLYKP